MQTLLDPEVRDTGTDDDSYLHLYCTECYPNGGEVSYCGKDISEDEEWDSWSPEDECVLCVVVEEQWGERCPNGHLL